MSSTTLDHSADASYDPLECLSKPIFEASDLPVTLLFVYHSIYADHREYAARSLGNMIQGHDSVADIWTLWRPGDEEWLRSNLRKDGDGWLPDHADCEEARKGYRRRVDRLAGGGVPDLWPASVKGRIWKADAPTRASAIAWLILISPFVTHRKRFRSDFSYCINMWIQASGNLLDSLVLPIQPFTEFVETLPDSDHTCSFWHRSASSWATLFSWLYNYHDYHVLVALCDNEEFLPLGSVYDPCKVCRSIRHGPSSPRKILAPESRRVYDGTGETITYNSPSLSQLPRIQLSPTLTGPVDLSQDSGYNHHTHHEVRDIEYSMLRQSADPDGLVDEGKPEMLSMLQDVVDSLCDSNWITQHREDRNDHQQWLLDLLQRFLDRPRRSWARDGADAAETIAQQDQSTYKSTVHRLVVKLSKESELLPTSIFLRGVSLKGGGLVAGGGFADIFAGFWAGRKVAIKRLRLHIIPLRKREDIKQMLCREALIWRGLWHRYVLPCLGVDDKLFEPPYICMVSPYMDCGTVVEYCSEKNLTANEIDLILNQVASGLAYLHGENVVHGDLRGANILMNDRGHCQLADFGLAVFAEATKGAYTATRGEAGSTRWMAPELLLPESFGMVGTRRTCATDIFAYGCVCIELHTGLLPFYNFTSEGAVVHRILAGEHPQTPPGKELPPKMRNIAEKCWRTTPDTRPTAKGILEEFRLTIKSVPSQQSSGPTFIANVLESDSSTQQDDSSDDEQVNPSDNEHSDSAEHEADSPSHPPGRLKRHRDDSPSSADPRPRHRPREF